MDNQQTASLEANLTEFRSVFKRLQVEIGRAIVGQEATVTDCLVAIFAQGHVLLEGVPGLGKTFLVRMLARVLGLSSGRVQCTPDLMPADILGTHIVGDDGTGRRGFRFEKGPVFKHLLLVDEINRATPKTQAALLEAMQERAVTAGSERFPLPSPFFTLATQNPLEMEGTYPLPEAQLDRFFYKLKVPFPMLGELVEIANRTTKFQEPELSQVISGDDLARLQEALSGVAIAQPLTEYAARLVVATHPELEASPAPVRKYVAYGASPRGLQALIKAARIHAILDNRTAVANKDLRLAAKPALRHRLVLNFEGEAESINTDKLVEQILEAVPTPAEAS